MVNCGGLAAQSGTSSAISGTVTDTSGAVVPGASVTATEIDTKATRAGVDRRRWATFCFRRSIPGTYEVTVRAKGFATQTSQPTPVGVGRTVTLNFTLPCSVGQRRPWR